ncbi:hypothetical protein DFH07DRAFT_218506 [Mycena maculata]|uniref:Uncharacterized protein n=1 Tax=Mycena maculata TaxID=230809 RepID=A0AAD7HW41_9AGAR|nr:hypothetical protein DFH07DRAFT_218506 [Mycena maculata]
MLLYPFPLFGHMSFSDRILPLWPSSRAKLNDQATLHSTSSIEPTHPGVNVSKFSGAAVHAGGFLTVHRRQNSFAVFRGTYLCYANLYSVISCRVLCAATWMRQLSARLRQISVSTPPFFPGNRSLDIQVASHERVNSVPSSMPLIVECDLMVHGRELDDTQSMEVELPFLQKCSLYGNTDSEISSSLVLPALEEFSISIADDSPMGGVLTLIQRSVSPDKIHHLWLFPSRNCSCYFRGRSNSVILPSQSCISPEYGRGLLQINRPPIHAAKSQPSRLRNRHKPCQGGLCPEPQSYFLQDLPMYI